MIRVEVVSDALRRNEVVFNGQTSLRKVAGIETDPVGLADMPFTLRVFNTPIFLVYVASFPDAVSFQGQDLVDVLSQARREPTGFGDGNQNATAILDDWQILTEEGKKVPYLKSLYDNHLANDPFIREIEEHHMPKFYPALKTTSLNEVKYYLADLANRVRSFEGTLSMCGLEFTDTQDKRKIQKQQRFVDFLQSWMLYSKASQRELLSTTLYQRDMIFYSAVHSTLAPLSVRHRLELGPYLRPGSYIYISEQDPPQTFNGYSGNPFYINRDTVFVRKLDNGMVQIQRGSGTILVEFVKRKGSRYKIPQVVPGSLQVEDCGVCPVVIFEEDKESKEREYFCGSLPLDWQEQFPDLFHSRQDTLFGQLVVGAYSENVRRTLPTKLSMQFINPKTGEKEIKWQYMREAQMPDLIQRYARRYLRQSPVIAGFSSLAHSKS